jgi:phosphoribosylformimino-5-aminoimidazole carboxamide ribotide isomerase
LQVGGGVRDDESAEALFIAGVDRVVVGTAALEEPDWVRTLARKRPGRVAVGLDANGRDIAVRGWTESSGRDLVEVGQEFEDSGVDALIVTEIGRDGTLAGPALDQLAAVLEATSLDVVASGGVGSLPDLVALAGLHVSGRRLGGAIDGRAIYQGAFTVADATAALAEQDTERTQGR